VGDSAVRALVRLLLLLFKESCGTGLTRGFGATRRTLVYAHMLFRPQRQAMKAIVEKDNMQLSKQRSFYTILDT
jgi:hypothetical protein